MALRPLELPKFKLPAGPSIFNVGGATVKGLDGPLAPFDWRGKPALALDHSQWPTAYTLAFTRTQAFTLHVGDFGTVDAAGLAAGDDAWGRKGYLVREPRTILFGPGLFFGGSTVVDDLLAARGASLIKEGILWVRNTTYAGLVGFTLGSTSPHYFDGSLIPGYQLIGGVLVLVPGSQPKLSPLATQFVGGQTLILDLLPSTSYTLSVHNFSPPPQPLQLVTQTDIINNEVGVVNANDPQFSKIGRHYWIWSGNGVDPVTDAAVVADFTAACARTQNTVVKVVGNTIAPIQPSAGELFAVIESHFNL